MITKPKVTIRQIEENIQSGITWASSPNKSFGNLRLLNVSDKESPDFATLELNEYELNGQFGKEIENIAFMSDSLSDDECFFDNVWVEGTFQNVSDVYVTSIEFGDNYPKKISIEKYSNNELIDTEIIDNIDSKTIFSKKPIIGSNKIKINFLESWAPYQYAHLQSWIIGGDIIFSGDDISELTLNENTDPISNRLEIDTAHITILDKYDNFNLLTDSQINKFVSIGAEVQISVNIVDGDIERDIFLGKYYIKEMKFDVNHSMILECETFLGLMDKVKFPGLSQIIFAYNTPIEQCNLKLMIDRVFQSAFNYLGVPRSEWSNFYEIVDDLSNVRVYGYIPVMTCREALRHLAFVHNLTISDNRNKKILIKKYNSNFDLTSNISSDKITSEPLFEKKDKVSSATANINRYSLSNETREILEIQKFSLDISEDYEVSPPFRYSYYEATDPRGGQLTLNFFYTTNVVILNDIYPSIFTLKIFGKDYSNDQTKYTKSFQIDDGKPINISNSNLITSSNVTEVIDNYVSFANNNYIKLKVEYINTNEETGKYFKLDLLKNTFVGYLVYQSLDVAHGMISNAEFIGKLNTN